MGIWRAESPRNFEPIRATLSRAQGVSPGYGVVIRPEPRQLAGWQIRMSVPFMLSIDYLHINAHPYLPPTRSARGSVTIFTLPHGFRLRPAGYAETGTPWAIELTAPPVGGAQNSARWRSQTARQIPIYRALYSNFGTRVAGGPARARGGEAPGGVL